MKKIFLILLITIGILFIPQEAKAWLDCPFGRINDPYPGLCYRYLDTNNNKICDRSETAPDNFDDILGWTANFLQDDSNKNSVYFGLAFLSVTFYFCTWYIVFKTGLNKKIKWVNQLNFKLLWNSILLLSFLTSAITGLLLLFDIAVTNPLLIPLHNKTGFIFIIIALIHFLTRLSFFLTAFRKLTKP